MSSFFNYDYNGKAEPLPKSYTGKGSGGTST